jgi:hypothetical protein
MAVSLYDLTRSIDIIAIKLIILISMLTFLFYPVFKSMNYLTQIK